MEGARAFYGGLFEFELRGKNDTMAFIDLGDQFIALQKGRKQPADDSRHFGLVVDDKEAARAALKAAGVAPIEGPFLDFRDPWGNRIEIVGYDNVQFTKAPNVLRGMGLTHLTKNENAQRERAERVRAWGQGGPISQEWGPLWTRPPRDWRCGADLVTSISAYSQVFSPDYAPRLEILRRL